MKRMYLTTFSLLVMVFLVFTLSGCDIFGNKQSESTASSEKAEISEDNTDTAIETVSETKADGMDEQVVEELLSLANDVEIAETPEICDGIGDVYWGIGYENFLEDQNIEIVRHNVFYGDHFCTARYIFGPDRTLVLGVYVFNEMAGMPWTSAMRWYLDMRKDLLAKYGEPLVSSLDKDLQEVITEGNLAYGEVWNMKTSEDKYASITLSIHSSGIIELSFADAYCNVF